MRANAQGLEGNKLKTNTNCEGRRRAVGAGLCGGAHSQPKSIHPYPPCLVGFVIYEGRQLR